MTQGIIYTFGVIAGCALYAAAGYGIWYLLYCCYLNCPGKMLRYIPREAISMGCRWWVLFFVCVLFFAGGTIWFFWG